MPGDDARPTRARRIAALAGPWILLPAALYVAFLPIIDTTVSLRRIAVIGAVGVLAVVLPAAALRFLELRRGASAAVRAFAAGVIAALLLVAITSGVGPWVLAVAALMQVSAYGFGRSLADRVALDEDARATWQGVPLRVAVGWAVLLVAFLAAGTVGLLTRPVVAAIYVAGIALIVPGLRRGARASDARRGGAGRPVASPPDAASTGPPSIVWWWGLALLLLIGYVGAVAPEVRHDALTAHLPIAREFAARHAIVEMRQNTASYFQINADLLYATAMALIPDERLPKLMHFAAGVIASLVIYAVGTRIWSRRAGLIGAALFAGTPLVWWLAGTTYADLWVALFAVAAVHAVVLYYRSPGPPRAFAAGLLAGASVGVKISSAALAVPLLVVLLARGRKERRVWATLAAVIAGAVLTGAYSYARAWMLTGNPVFPLLRSLFGPPGGMYPDRLLWPLLGMGAGLWDLALLPWRVTRFPQRFVEDASLGVGYLVLLPLMLLAIGRRRVPVWITATFVLAGLTWFWTSQYLRFALPILPVVALLAGAGAAEAPGGRRAAAGAALILGGMLALNAGAWVAPGPPNFPYTVAAGLVTRFDYTARYVPGFLVSDFARRALPPDARIAGVGDSWSYHYERLFVPISWYGRMFSRALRSMVLEERTAADFQRSLSAAGFTHVVVYPDAPALRRSRERNVWVTREAFWEDGLRLEYAAGGFYLFTLTGSGGVRTRGPTLLDQPSAFAEGSDRRSLEVLVQAGKLYALEARVRSAAPDVEAAVAIQWFSADGREVGTGTARTIRAGTREQRRAMACTAPPGAQRAIITLSGSAGRPVEFRNVLFYELR